VEIKTNHIIAYLKGNLTAEEEKDFREKLRTSAEFRKEVEDITFIWKMSAELQLHKQVNTERNWKQLAARIRVDKYKKKIWTVIRTSAAILLLPLLISTYLLYIQNSELNNQPISQLQVQSAYGTVTQTTLPDGTKVWLNSGSILTYPQVFKGKREVSLTGEAYFDVTSDPSNRFDVIVSDQLTVSAYGTEFNINAYPEDSTIDVSLITGNVELVTTDNLTQQAITPGQHAVYNKTDENMDISYTNLTVKTAWKYGKMMFRRASMPEVVERLSRHFNVDIRLEGVDLYNYEYNATFTTETLNEILQLLEESAPIQYKIIDPKQSDDYSYSKRVVIISLRE